jgi:hypothetical protein
MSCKLCLANQRTRSTQRGNHPVKSNQYDPKQSMTIGVLALQGDFDAHRRRLEELGAEVVLIKKPEQLDAIDGLVIPGGESGTFLKLLGEEGFAKLKAFVHAKPTFGTCAGAILLATEVENPQAGRPRRAQHPHPPQRLRTPDRQLHPPGQIYLRKVRLVAHRNGLHPRPQNRAHRRRRRSNRDRRQPTPSPSARASAMAATFHPELSDDPASTRRF